MRSLLVIMASAVALAALACGPRGADTATPGDGTGGGDTMEVKLCDDHTSTEVPTDMERTRANGQKIADSLMSQWRHKNPGKEWESQARRSWTIVPPADNSDVLVGEQRDSHAYGAFTKTDVATWKRETERLVLEGARVFHTADELGSTIAVSCDMCHPDAANTHPETYPKFQTQMGRVVLLRDMINWCLEHPVRAPAMEPDDPRMRAMEAYIWAQRKGTELQYGKH